MPRLSLIATKGIITALFILPLLAPGTGAPRESARILTVGNSFAGNATSHLPALAKAGGKQLVIFPANIGGASLERQVRQIELFEEKPGAEGSRPYANRKHPRTGERRDFSLREALEAEAWDVVTIQQRSRSSFDASTYEPHASRLIEFIRRHAPSAEIMVHQTWAYREDHPFFENESLPKEKRYPGSNEHRRRLAEIYASENEGILTPETMHERLRAAYDLLATTHGLRLIPVGEAFHAARRTPRWTFSFPDPGFDYANPPAGKVPVQHGSLNPGWQWHTNSTTGVTEFVYDGWHANAAGQYLGSCVFYLTLYNEDSIPETPVPAGLSEHDAADLRRIALATVLKHRHTKQ